MAIGMYSIPSQSLGISGKRSNIQKSSSQQSHLLQSLTHATYSHSPLLLSLSSSCHRSTEETTIRKSEFGLAELFESRQLLSTMRSCLNMGKMRVEICLISARGLRRTSSLWKLQWFAVGWIDPNNKYCTKIDASGNANPTWKTKFSALVDNSGSNFQDLALHIEVYSREPIFLRERLQGTATVILKEFLAKYNKNSEVSNPDIEEVGSFQLRKRNSSKPQGFVDVSIRVFEEREGGSSYSGNEEGFTLSGHNNSISLATQEGSVHAYPPLPLPGPYGAPYSHLQTNFPYAHPMPLPTNYSNASVGGPSYPSAGGPSYPSAGGPSYHAPPPRPLTPPPPPPPSNIGYIPTFLPRTDHQMPATYVNMPSSGAAPGRPGGPGFGMGVGAGALAAGAVIFGDDFMSGFDFPGGLQDASLSISTYPPF